MLSSQKFWNPHPHATPPLTRYCLSSMPKLCHSKTQRTKHSQKAGYAHVVGNLGCQLDCSIRNHGNPTTRAHLWEIFLDHLRWEDPHKSGDTHAGGSLYKRIWKVGFGFLSPACPHSHCLVHPPCCWGIPSLVIRTYFFRIPTQTNNQQLSRNSSGLQRQISTTETFSLNNWTTTDPRPFHQKTV